jgi:hypothetical protein
MFEHAMETSMNQSQAQKGGGAGFFDNNGEVPF